MRHNKLKKGFTLVELLVVIAILAILATFSIVGYSSFTKKAKYSNDVTLVTEWNQLLDAKDVLAQSSEDEKLDNVVEVKDFFKENGTNDSTFAPASSGYHFYWSETDNNVYLVEDDNSNFTISYPEDEENTNVTKDNSYRLDLEYCLLTGEIAGFTFSRNALVVGEENEVTITGDSVPNKIKIGTEILTITDCKFTVTPADTTSLAISQDTTVYVSSVTVDPTTLILYVGGNSTLNAVIDPNDADNKNVTWSSSDEGIATVTASGVVNAISEGTATITATTVDGGKTGTCNVTVSKNTASVNAPTAKTGLTYSNSEQELVNAGITDGGTWQYKLGDGEYSITVPKATDAGTYTVYYKLVGDETYNDIAEASVQVTIAPKSLSNGMIADISAQTYSGSALTPDVTVKDGETTLTKDTDYTVSYTNNTNTGTATVTITCKGNYTETASKDFAINKARQDAPSNPTFKLVHDTAVVLYKITTTGYGTVQYAYGTTDGNPTSQWYDSDSHDIAADSDDFPDEYQNLIMFGASTTGLQEYKKYYFFARYKGDDNHEPSEASTGTEATTECFVAGTKITMADGSVKNIEEIVIGDEVISYDVVKGEFYTTTINKVWTSANTTISTITLTDGTQIQCTPNHPICTTEGFKSVNPNFTGGLKEYPSTKMNVGDLVVTDHGTFAVSSIETNVGESVAVYNLSVVSNGNELNNTFVANGVVAHNKAS